MNDSRNLNCPQSTTARCAVSNERQHGGVEKKTPIEYVPATDGGIKPGRASDRNPAEGHRGYISTSGVVSVNPKNHHFLLDYFRIKIYII
jgi:hypothetical protein